MLTSAQLATLKAAIVADSTLNAQPLNSDGAFTIAAALNLTAAPDFFVWATAVPTQTVFDQITWANLTPLDAVPTTPSLAVELWTARALACQGKQFNLQTLLLGQATINGAKSNVRAGLQDALTSIPSGVGGALQAANWPAVRTALARKATRFEKIFADTAAGNGGTAATAATMVIEGAVSYQDVEQARLS